MIAAADADSDRPIRFGREGAIAPLTLNRPNAANAIDMVLAKALMEALIVCDDDLLAAESGRDPEGRERVAALLTKRKPDFKGNTHG